jgi:TonB family protein
MRARLSLRFAAAWRTRRFAVNRRAERSKESHVRMNAPQSDLHCGYSGTNPQPKPTWRYNLLRCSVLAVCFFALGVPSARSWQMHLVQQRPTEPPETLDTLADELTEAIVDFKERSVIVFDFAGPDGIPSASEKSLADDFNVALTRASRGFVVLDRTRISESLQKKNLITVDLNNPHNAVEAAKEMKAQAYVWGSFAIGHDNFDLLVEAYGVQDGKKIAGFRATLPLTDSMKDAAEQRSRKSLESGLAQPGKDGYTFPACVYCPQAQYTQLAEWHHFEGSLTLSMLVTADGRADNVVAIKALPYGLTDKAIETVRSWKFKPAQGSDGSPVAVRQSVEMTFRITSLD